jgi:hypothetical protein
MEGKDSSRGHAGGRVVPGDGKRIVEQAARRIFYDDADIGFAITPLEVSPVEEPPTNWLNPGKGRIIVWSVLAGMFLAAGLYAGFKLRRRRPKDSPDPYHVYEAYDGQEVGADFEAMGI